MHTWSLTARDCPRRSRKLLLAALTLCMEVALLLAGLCWCCWWCLGALHIIVCCMVCVYVNRDGMHSLSGHGQADCSSEENRILLGSCEKCTQCLASICCPTVNIQLLMVNPYKNRSPSHQHDVRRPICQPTVTRNCQITPAASTGLVDVQRTYISMPLVQRTRLKNVGSGHASRVQQYCQGVQISKLPSDKAPCTQSKPKSVRINFGSIQHCFKQTLHLLDHSVQSRQVASL